MSGLMPENVIISYVERGSKKYSHLGGKNLIINLPENKAEL
jgi:hypothetical protein